VAAVRAPALSRRRAQHGLGHPPYDRRSFDAPRSAVSDRSGVRAPMVRMERHPDVRWVAVSHIATWRELPWPRTPSAVPASRHLSPPVVTVRRWGSCRSPSQRPAPATRAACHTPWREGIRPRQVKARHRDEIGPASALRHPWLRRLYPLPSASNGPAPWRGLPRSLLCLWRDGRTRCTRRWARPEGAVPRDHRKGCAGTSPSAEGSSTDVVSRAS
jgi:hypothetical protein